jgi:PHD/YefM family antitoxin component YafN of YafNO toxin-antitoxin module
MREVNVAQLRRSVAHLARELEHDGEPTLLEVGNQPVGVIASLRDFRERFALENAKAERRALMEEILADRVPSRARAPAT